MISVSKNSINSVQAAQSSWKLDIDGVDKSLLINAEGLHYRDFKKSLRPKWLLLWADILSGYLVLAITTLILVADFSSLRPYLAVLGSFVFGLTHAYIQLFFHEAAHCNLAKNRKLNDLLANYVIGIFTGQDIKRYRAIHFDHHRWLGTIKDTEQSYFDPLNMRFIIEIMFGIKALRVLINRRKRLQVVDKEKKTFEVSSQLIRALILHALILGLAVWYYQWSFIFAWIIGMGVIFPFFSALRQVLEHRDINAKSNINYRLVPHGRINRLFGDSLFARVLGGAGFNRHLLHHWEPQIPCTQLRKLEKYLLGTQAASFITGHRSSYLGTLIKLMRAK